MKRLILITAVLLLVFSLSASASPAINQVIELKQSNDGLTLVATEPTTLWESPSLRAGEAFQSHGTLTLVNKTDVTRDITFDCVKFPYDDELALEYLNHLTLQIKTGETVLYNGPYSRINDTDVKPNLNVTLSADESCSYTILLSCDYTYSGDHYVDDSVLEWQFSTKLDSQVVAEEEEKEPIHDPLFTQWIIAAVATILIFVFLKRYAQQR